MQIHEKYNLTRFVTGFGFCQDKQGLEYVVAVLKATYVFDEKGRLTIPERKMMAPVFMQDQFYDQPDNSSLKYPCDIVHAKQGADVVLIGRAYGRQRKQVLAGFQFNALQKIIDVCGARRWEKALGSNSILGPAPFETLALSYENAYGGAFEHEKHGQCIYDLNPVGIGFGEKNAQGLALPFLEYPQQKIKSPKDRPLPAALGAIAPGWRQRVQFAGTFDQAWFDERRPLWPIDFDERYYNAAPQDQVLKSKLQGGERLTLVNVHPKTEQVELTIPKHTFTALFRIKERTEKIFLTADTLIVEPDEHRFMVSYCGAVPIGNDIRFLKSIHFEEV